MQCLQESHIRFHLTWNGEWEQQTVWSNYNIPVANENEGVNIVKLGCIEKLIEPWHLQSKSAKAKNEITVKGVLSR